MKKCKECNCNKDGNCLLSYVYLVRNRRETIEYKDVKDIKECKHDIEL